MSNRTPLEDQIKNLFDQYEPEVPEYLWERVQQERKRRPVAFLFGWNKTASLVVLLGIGIIGLLGWYGWSSYNNASEERAVTSHSNSPIEKNNHPAIKTVATSEEKITASKKQNASTPSTFENISSNTFSLTEMNADKRKTNQEEKISDVLLVNKKSTKKISSSKRVKTISAKIEEDIIVAAKEIEIKKGEGESSLAEPSDMVVNTLRLSKGLPDKVIEKTPVKLTIPCPASPNPAWNKAYFEFYGGPDYVSRQFSDTNTSFANMRRESTSFRYAYSFGVRYGRVFNNGLMLKTGLNYSLLTEKFDYIQGNIINIIYVTDATGDTISSYQSTSVRHKITYNKYRTIDVPLLAGYEIAKGRWNFNFSGGLVINLYSWNRGEVLDRSLQPVSINSGESPNPYQLKTNIGMGLQSGAGVYYGLGQQAKLFVEPYFRYNLSSMTQSEITLKQRFHTAGLKVGLRIDFDKK